ncbi:MAG: 50S ribosomal protein L32 [Candidatus Cloacimonadales bacterium]|jgi:large subunit ribosomal protein L32|nr:50S ribosomal protein L32 [Candidatus Cloacimonadota bacterium]MDD2649975.1 50S ribosomal protein L32 [Candidatus Cloacimonadota bacterium]MDD3501555.1 50S ribosomal protein L32 [Candidatus Cloacimonadota bacterium]MDX9976505.1 50S ribosomal protein L32 [Candidatus Cloacimonadales bacterium]
MAVPKRKTSKARRDKRRTHDALSIPSWSNCPNCSEPTRPHYVCSKCGFYKGKQILEAKQ